MRREVHVRRQVQLVNGGGVEIRPPKYGSERTVYVPEDLVQILSEHVRVNVPAMIPTDGCLRVGAEYLCTKSSAWYLWNKTREKAGVRFRLHDLRHFYASGLIAAGCDVVTVQRAVGHASASFTLSTHSHLWPKAEDRTRKAAAHTLTETLTADRVRTTGQ